MATGEVLNVPTGNCTRFPIESRRTETSCDSGGLMKSGVEYSFIVDDGQDVPGVGIDLFLIVPDSFDGPDSG